MDGANGELDAAVRAALATDETIDITTTGRRSGRPQRIEIWFRRVGERIFITGTPGRRDWYANLAAEPTFTFHLKESTRADLAAEARLVVDGDERRAVFGHPSMRWYVEQVETIDDLVDGSPLVEVSFRP
ncbi:MAG: nitroreductase/quinone reductase family protein [Actinomycetota bacterium]|nr:nitroreductase/quinone reductase family protein [Actinomycetota bacterium]